MTLTSFFSFSRWHVWRIKYSVARWPLLGLIVALWLCSRWLRAEYGQEDTNLWLVMELFFRLVVAAMAALIITSVGTSLLVWLLFRWRVTNKKIAVSLSLGDGQQAEAGQVAVTVQLKGQVWRPLLGSVQARLVFARQGMSPPVLLDENVYAKGEFFKRGIRGTAGMPLTDICIYDVENVWISFMDMLGLVSLPASLASVQQLYTVPLAKEARAWAAPPHATEEQKHRIQLPKRVEGEYVNYKEFETGDNIQRIVWKIYAKSGQLVVRIPETKDPYASHVYLYASYFHGWQPGQRFDAALLNRYKEEVRHLMESVARQGYEVRLPADQEVPKVAGVGDKKSELFQISAASWQNRLSPSQFVQPAKAALVCLPTCVPAAEVEGLLQKLPPAVPVVLITLSEAIPSPFRFSWRDVFFKPEKKPTDALRQSWLVSPLRRALQRNEKALAALTKKRDQVWLVETIDAIR
ncbi:MAG: DUF58 domain-containing protein [Cyclobacteriaceae bacterium]|jgi:uncharacterized protein (DUF58 family)|nr:DUF58 domain-containing protein [Cyclobacteriaceae bacterium]